MISHSAATISRFAMDRKMRHGLVTLTAISDIVGISIRLKRARKYPSAIIEKTGNTTSTTFNAIDPGRHNRKSGFPFVATGFPPVGMRTSQTKRAYGSTSREAFQKDSKFDGATKKRFPAFVEMMFQKERRLGATPNTQPDEEKDVSGFFRTLPAVTADNLAWINEQFLCQGPRFCCAEPKRSPGHTGVGENGRLCPSFVNAAPAIHFADQC